MKKTNSKAFRIIAVTIGVALLICIIVALSNCREVTPSQSLEIPQFTVSNNNSLIFDSEAPHAAAYSIETGSLTVENLSEDKLNLTLYYTQNSSTSAEQLSVTLDSKSKHTSEVTDSAITAIYFEYTQNETDLVKCSFALDLHGLDLMIASTPAHIILPRNISASDIEITRPLNIILDNSTLTCDEIYLNTDGAGSFIIEDKGTSELECNTLFADAVNCDIVTPNISKVDKNPAYYLRAKSYNHKTVNYRDITVNSLDSFLALIDQSALPTLYPDTKLTLRSFTITDEIQLSSSISLHFASDFTLEKAIKIETDNTCTLTYSADAGAKLPGIPVTVVAPAANVNWDIPRPSGITLFDIANSMTVATLNGKKPTEYALGGDGNAKLSTVNLYKDKNPNITESIIWSCTDYVFTATIDCVVDINTLKNAILDLKATNGGKITFDQSVTTEEGKINLLANSGCYCTVTDANGKNIRYLIETKYVPSKIPVVVINTTDGAEITSNEEYIGGTCYINCDPQTGFSSVDESPITIRGRGHSTWKWEKKPYKIKFDSKTSVFGLEAAKDWVLLANYTDKSLIRNFVAMEGAKVLDNLIFTSVQYPVDVFLNGEYIGVYTMGEQLEAKDGRIELKDNGTELDTGYLLEIGGTSSEDVWNETCFYTTLCKYVKVKAPDEESLTKEQVKYIRDYVQKADNAVMSGVGYEDYIDIDSLIDWVIVHELYYNIDSCFRRSCYFTKEPGGKLKMGPIWDFDNAFGNFWKDDKTYSTWATADSDSGYIWDNWMSYLINYPEFRMKFKARWDEVKYDLLEKLMQSIDIGAENIERSAEYNFKKWDILNKRVGCQDSSIVKYNTFEKQITYFRDFVNKRWKWLDENI